MKVFICPHPSTYAEDGIGSGGIWRVINAQAQWLPEYGIELVDDPKESNLYCLHAGMFFDWEKPAVQVCHGYYWTGDFQWDRAYWQYNSHVIEVSRRALSIITPSEWVAQPIRKDLRKTPVVIPHGVNIEDYKLQEEHEDFVLWAKPRVDIVSNPQDMNALAQMAPNMRFVSTFGRATKNVSIIGALPYDKFKEVQEKATLWLATARETGDICSREMMAMGIPVIGWDWGATAELVRHRETGYLAEPGNYDDLLEGLNYCLQNRKRLGEAARIDIAENYQWKDAMRCYATVFQEALEGDVYPVEVSIIVPTYNYAHFLDECLNSIREQTFYKQHPNKVEVIVVDDASTDNTQDILSQHAWPGLRMIRHEKNLGLPGALNTGQRAARGKYITNLDADNLFTPNAIQLLYDAFQSKKYLDVASGGLAIYSKEGTHRKANDWPFGMVNPGQQLNHINQVVSSSMMRASSVSRLGGYRERQLKNEDGEYWCRAISAGLRFEQVTDEPVLVYRWHEDNKTKREGGEDDPEGPLAWNFHYPWRKVKEAMPFGSTVPSPTSTWPVRSFESPHIAVIIPCGPGHQKYIVDALDSVAGQTFPNIECVVANDTGEPLDVASMGHPWVTVVDTAGRLGPAIARNTAIAVAKAPLIVPLDADDMLYPNTLLKFYEAWLSYPDSLVYGDCDIEDEPGKRRGYNSGPWSWEKIRREAVYQDVCLFAKQWWYAVGGYPIDQHEGLWEDWLFGVKLHLAGIGATYIEEPWGVYRHWTALQDGRSKNDVDNADYGTEEFKAKYRLLLQWVERKEKEMPCPGCGGTRVGRTANLAAQRIMEISGDEIHVIYNGPRQGSISINSKAIPRLKYRIQQGVVMTIPKEDGWIVGLPGFQRVVEEKPKEVVEIPKVPPQPPSTHLSVEIPAPTVSFAELLQQSAEEVLGGPNGFWDMFSHIGRLDKDILVKRGFDSLEKIQEDLERNDGAKLLQINGIGPSTIRRMREAISA